VLGPRDARRKPLSELLLYAWERYHRPIIIGETSGFQDHRAEWLRMTIEECMKALLSGVNLQGACLFPCVDMPDWNSGEWAKIGMFDVPDHSTCERCACDPYLAELKRWIQLLDQPDSVDPDTLNGSDFGRVELSEIRKHAEEWERQTPGSQRAHNTIPQAA
jgi:hypothetical protein